MSQVHQLVVEAGAKVRALELALKLKRSPPVILMYHGVSAGAVPDSLRNCEGKHMAQDLFAPRDFPERYDRRPDRKAGHEQYRRPDF